MDQVYDRDGAVTKAKRWAAEAEGCIEQYMNHDPDMGRPAAELLAVAQACAATSRAFAALAEHLPWGY